MVASFSAGGQQLSKIEPVHCSVWVDRTRTTALLHPPPQQRDVNFDFVLPDGSALVVYSLRLCPFAASEPHPEAPDQEYQPQDYGANQSRDGGFVARGRVAWFASATKQDQVRFYDLTDLTTGDVPGVADFRLRRQGAVPATREPGSSVPIFADWDELVRHPKMNTPEWDKWQAEGRVLSVSAQLSAVSPNSAGGCSSAIDGVARQGTWVILPAGTCFGGSPKPARLRLDDQMRRIELLASGPDTSPGVGFTRAALTERGVKNWLGEPALTTVTGQHVHWNQDICVEEQCFALELTEQLDRWFVFYHPPTGRLLELSTQTMEMADLAW